MREQVDQILSSILPPELQAAVGGHTDKPTDDQVLDDLPLVKVEPYIALRVLSGPPPTREGTAAPVATPNRDVLADAAERRRGGASSGATSDEPPPPPSTTTAAAAAASSPEEATFEIRGTGSAFGTPLADLVDGVGYAPLVAASPRDGASDFTNTAALKGSIALMWRGGCSFVDKVRRAQAAGCVGAVVVQSAGQKWPFTMSDTAGKGADLLLPSLMISPADGEALFNGGDGGGRAAADDHDVPPPRLPTPAIPPPPHPAGGGGLWAHASARDHRTSCAVCLQEMLAEELAVHLPCDHRFHERCARQWLSKQHTCPTCRAPLPRKGARDGAAERRESEERDAGGELPTWADFAPPRGNAPMPASSMYT